MYKMARDLDNSIVAEKSTVVSQCTTVVSQLYGECYSSGNIKLSKNVAPHAQGIYNLTEYVTWFLLFMDVSKVNSTPEERYQ